jgi:hypothetical protein
MFKQTALFSSLWAFYCPRSNWNQNLISFIVQEQFAVSSPPESNHSICQDSFGDRPKIEGTRVRGYERLYVRGHRVKPMHIKTVEMRHQVEDKDWMVVVGVRTRGAMRCDGLEMIHGQTTDMIPDASWMSDATYSSSSNLAFVRKPLAFTP